MKRFCFYTAAVAQLAENQFPTLMVGISNIYCRFGIIIKSFSIKKLSMKSKHFLLLSIIFLFQVKKTFSQDLRFIEISSVDTIELKPVQFIYQISLQNSVLDFGDFATTMSGKMNSDRDLSAQTKLKPKNNVSYKQVINTLDSTRFVYTISEGNNYSINTNKSNDSIVLVTINSEADLKKIYHLFNTVDNMTSHISHIEYESISSHKNDVYAKLYLKAKTDAMLIANLSGNSIGQLISVDEEKNFITDVIDEIKDTEMNFTSIFPFQKNKNFNKQVYKKLLFKFQLK